MYIAEDNISFLKLTFPSEFLERYKDGAIIKKSWTVRFTETTAIFFGARTLSIDNLTNARLEAIKRIVLGVRLEELVEYIPETEVADLIGYLDREALIRPAYKNEFVGTAWEKQVEFFADFVDDPNAAQRRLLATSVCVVGCGGTGNTVIQHLTSAGIQKFILIDDDLVEKGNFNRQFCFSNDDIGKPKIEAMKAYIIARNPQAEVHTICERVENSIDLDRLLVGDLQPDVIVGCADTPPVVIHISIVEYCLKNNIICTFGGLGIHFGQVGPLLTEASHQQRYLEHRQEQLKFMSRLTAADGGTGIPTGSISYMAATVSSLMVADLIDLLAGIKTPPSLNTLGRYNPYSRSVLREQQY
jgi:molybdopterin/thiamine biosynthesis adenylyltransferase